MGRADAPWTSVLPGRPSARHLMPGLPLRSVRAPFTSRSLFWHATDIELRYAKLPALLPIGTPANSKRRKPGKTGPEKQSTQPAMIAQMTDKPLISKAARLSVAPMMDFCEQ